MTSASQAVITAAMLVLGVMVWNFAAIAYLEFSLFHTIITILAKSNCSTDDLRLADGNNMFEGRVEICRGGVWGAVTSSGWSFANAQITCRQLGYPTECK